MNLRWLTITLRVAAAFLLVASAVIFDMFQKALDNLNDLRSRRGTLGSNEKWAREIAGEIAKCDTALGK